MIQRIQSIYLLLVAILNGLLFVLPLNNMLIKTGNLEVSVLGLFKISEGNKTLINELFPLFALTLFTILIAIISIFLFKKRKVQMRLSLYNSILGLALSFLAIYYTTQIANSNNTNLNFSVGLLIPVSGAILSFLAFKAIKKDDDLVKSVDRIR